MAAAAIPTCQVTLSTGDRVRISMLPGGRPGVTVLPGPHRAGLTFHVATTRLANGQVEVSVVPQDAAVLIDSGRLDPRQFTLSLQDRPDAQGTDLACRRGAAATAGLPKAQQLFTLQVKILSRAGQPDKKAILGTVVNTATGLEPRSITHDPATGLYSMQLPKGSYYVSGLTTQPAAAHSPGTSSVLIAPSVRLTRKTTLTLDGRTAQPVVTTVDHKGAVPSLQYLEIDQGIGGSSFGDAYGVVGMGPGKPSPALYVTPTAQVHGRPFVFTNHTSLASPASSPYANPGVPAKYEYNLFFSSPGAVPAGAALVHHVSTASLARVRTGYALQGPRLHAGDSAQQGNLPLLATTVDSFDVPVRVTPGGSATMYYSAAPGLLWFTNHLINDATFAPVENAPLTAYQAGHTYHASFSEAALGPAMTAERLGNQVLFVPALFTGSEPGHTANDVDGDSLVQTTLALGHTVIGTVVGPAAQFKLPAASHRYTLTEQATRPASWSVLGTQAAVTWHFRSAATTGLSVSSLLDVRVSGPFSLHDSAPAGQVIPLRVAVENASGQVTTLRLAASYDDGESWHSLRLTRAGGHWTASAGSPKGASFVSLRITAADSAGDSVTSTMIRAYALG